MNERIRAPQVRVIDENGAQVGVMTTKEALALAQSKELDLIEVAPNASPPVCRVMDYGKYKYAQSKRDRDQRRKQRGAEVKLLRLRPNIHEHDVAVKLKKLRAFLEEGNKVRLNMIFRSREMSHPDIGRQVLLNLAEQASDVGVVESHPRTEGRMMSMVLVPKGASAKTPGGQ
ncbi:MAG: translation initiation factor IF-3 [Armatimonadetes bacterium]|nr:translation initiation factor IF-3 [Armatimonadota bacterium]NIM23954.1 translation initiation factor IF-3 [Armatimonadota bacterium]NIM67801.1 translation initiation factor IF-3 [Armatimonadota bacterium]NIM76341.1 translation initiation factor IF-3 [Armatimonadota bacterium]NIN06035.1 translation initiation factor IF-3 [Armatimonadota bacterium]